MLLCVLWFTLVITVISDLVLGLEFCLVCLVCFVVFGLGYVAWLCILVLMVFSGWMNFLF